MSGAGNKSRQPHTRTLRGRVLTSPPELHPHPAGHRQQSTVGTARQSAHVSGVRACERRAGEGVTGGEEPGRVAEHVADVGASIHPRVRQMTWSSSMSSGYSSLEEDSEEFYFTAKTSFKRSPWRAARGQHGTIMWRGAVEKESRGHRNNGIMDVEKERDPLSYLSKEETKEKIQLYNAAVTDKLKMTLNTNGIYTGFIKVQMELRRPITVRTRTNAQSHANGNGNDTAFYLPKGSINILHISSTNTVREVIEALLKKFLVVDNPAKFALYKRCQKEDQVYLCRLSDREHPLYLRLVAGPNLETLSFVLREHETGDVMWEAFSIPELQNFLRILDKEEDEQMQSLKRRYSCYKEKLEEALGGVRKPG